MEVTKELLSNLDPAARWMSLKAEEEAIKAQRLAVEEELLELFSDLPEEGERSLRLDGYKITAKNAISVSAKVSAEFAAACAAGLVPATLWETRVHETGVKQLRRAALKQEEEALLAYGRILPLLNVKAAKTSFSVLRYEL